MAVSESQKKSRNKWDSENMKIVACKIRKDYADRFKKYAENNQTTPNALIRKYIFQCIGEKDGDGE